MKIDKTTLDNLRLKTEYELWAVNFFRSRFHEQRKENNSSYTIELGDSDQLKVTHSIAGSGSICDSAVKKTLKKFIPLAFGSSFKLQDMLIEWILQLNGINEWRFKEKKKEYSKLLANTSACFPSYLENESAINQAFYALYKEIISYRHTLTHGSSFLLRDDGSLEMTNKEGNKLVLTTDDQSVYHRLCCLIIEGILSHDDDLLYNLSTVKSDLSYLKPIHKISGFIKQHVRFEKIRIIVPSKWVKNEKPYSCEINIDKIFERVKSSKIDKIIPLLEVEGNKDDLVYTWNLPPSYVPQSGIFYLREDDPQYDCFLIKTTQK